MTKHPAKFSKELLPVFTRILKEYNTETVLDCFAGTGKIHSLPFQTTGLEIEQEWAEMHDGTICGDARDMPFDNESFDAVCTSPTYGNRMADHHNAKDGSKRNTYTHKLGRQLTDGNSGKMQWGDEYCFLHISVWYECYRVLKNDGIFILNFKNHIRNGKEVDAFSWHVATLINTGFKLRSVEQIKLKGNRFGENGKARIPFEYVATFQK